MGHEWGDQSEFEINATPEQVWEAIATGPGIDCWYMGRTEVEPREGGAVRTDLGGYVVESTVTAWEPPKRFGYRVAEREDGSFLALEWLIEGRDGGSTVLRSVASGFIGTDDWKAEYDATRRGGAFYMHNLAQYLTYFSGRSVTRASASVRPAGDLRHAWAALRAGLGLTGSEKQGDPVRLTPEGIAPLEGVLDYDTSAFLGVRTADGLHRFFPTVAGMSPGSLVVDHHLFAADVDQQATKRAWKDWLTRLFS